MEFSEYFNKPAGTSPTSASENHSEYDDLLTEINEDLRQTNDDVPEDEYTEESTEQTAEEQAIDKKRFAKLSKLGAKGIVKAVDLGNANLARKIAMADSALPYRADPEALEDLTEIIEEIIPKKAGEALAIPVWLQLLLYVLIAFLPVLFAAMTDRADNKILKLEKAEKRRLKMESKLLKKQIENQELRDKLDALKPKEPEAITETDNTENNE